MQYLWLCVARAQRRAVGNPSHTVQPYCVLFFVVGRAVCVLGGAMCVHRGRLQLLMGMHVLCCG